MTQWTNILLPDLGMINNQNRAEEITDWAVANNMTGDTIGISSRLLRFKNEQDVTFFHMSFTRSVMQ